MIGTAVLHIQFECMLCMLVSCFREWKGAGGDKGTCIPVHCCTPAHADSLRTQNYAHMFHHNSKAHTCAATNPVHEINHAETHSLFDVIRIRLLSPILLLSTGIYNLPLFFPPQWSRFLEKPKGPESNIFPVLRNSTVHYRIRKNP
jgi:hypothetical protein